MCVLVFRDGKDEKEGGKIPPISPMLGNTEVYTVSINTLHTDKLDYFFAFLIQFVCLVHCAIPASFTVWASHKY